MNNKIEKDVAYPVLSAHIPNPLAFHNVIHKCYRRSLRRHINQYYHFHFVMKAQLENTQVAEAG